MEYYVNVPLDRLEERLDFLVREGFHPEIRMTSVDYLMSLAEADFERLRGLIEKRSLSVFTHGPFFGLDIASLDKSTSEYSARSLMRGLEVTAALGGRIMVMHTGFLPFFSRGGRRHWFRNWSQRMPVIVESALELGVALALENSWEDRPEVLEFLLDVRPAGELKVCLDTGHLNVFSRLPISRWWKVLGEKVVALHLHDNDGLSDDHLPPGKGTFDFRTLINLLKTCDPLPLIDLEVDHEHAVEGRRYLESLFGQ